MTQKRSTNEKPFLILYEDVIGLPIIGPIIRHRFTKFGAVGLSGTFVNLAVLYFSHEVLFKSVQPLGKRLHFSLSLAIFLATLNNFVWNRFWTWKDRKGKTKHGLLVQMGQYYLACSLAIGLQYAFTFLFSKLVHYLFANVMAIIIAAILTYVLNDVWTFAIGSRSLGIERKNDSLK